MGMKIGTPPPPGVDKRPWGVADSEGNIVAKSWYEDNAKIVAGQKGEGHVVVELERKRKKVKRS
jgi:hypothetical protein